MIFVVDRKVERIEYLTMSDGQQYKIEKSKVYQKINNELYSNLWSVVDGPLAQIVKDAPVLRVAADWVVEQCYMSIPEFNDDYLTCLCGDGSGYYGIDIDGTLYESDIDAGVGCEPEWATCVFWYNK